MSGTLSVARHELAETFWVLWRATEGPQNDASFWASVAPAIDRLDVLSNDHVLLGPNRGAIGTALNPLRGIGAATRGQVEGNLRQLANVALAILEGDYTFRASSLSATTYLKFLRAAARADEAEPRCLNHAIVASDVVRHGRRERLDLAIVRIGIGRLVDEGLAEYAWDPPGGENEEAFRILDEDEFGARIEELEGDMGLEVDVAVKHAEPLRQDYQDLIRGIARKHNVAADGFPASGEVYLKVADLSGGVVESFKANVSAFAAELEAALTKPASAPTPHSITHNTFNNSGQAGAFGPNATAVGNVFNQQIVEGDINTVRDCFIEARRALAATPLDDETREIVDVQLATAEKQLAKEKPNAKLLLPMATTIATALTTAGATGQGVEYIHKAIEVLAKLIG